MNVETEERTLYDIGNRVDNQQQQGVINNVMSATTPYRNPESGASLILFIIIGAVLLSLVAGGVFVARQRGGEVAQNDAQTEQTETQVNPDGSEPGDTPAEEGAEVAAPGNQEEEEAAPAPTNTQDRPSQGSGSGTQNAQPTPNRAPSTGPSTIASTGPSGDTPSAIPSTGLADSLAIGGIGLASMTLAGIKYAQARRRYIASAKQQ